MVKRKMADLYDPNNANRSLTLAEIFDARREAAEGRLGEATEKRFFERPGGKTIAAILGGLMAGPAGLMGAPAVIGKRRNKRIQNAYDNYLEEEKGITEQMKAMPDVFGPAANVDLIEQQTGIKAPLYANVDMLKNLQLGHMGRYAYDAGKKDYESAYENSYKYRADDVNAGNKNVFTVAGILEKKKQQQQPGQELPPAERPLTEADMPQGQLGQTVPLQGKVVNQPRYDISELMLPENVNTILTQGREAYTQGGTAGVNVARAPFQNLQDFGSGKSSVADARLKQLQGDYYPQFVESQIAQNQAQADAYNRGPGIGSYPPNPPQMNEQTLDMMLYGPEGLRAQREQEMKNQEIQQLEKAMDTFLVEDEDGYRVIPTKKYAKTHPQSYRGYWAARKRYEELLGVTRSQPSDTKPTRKGKASGKKTVVHGIVLPD